MIRSMLFDNLGKITTALQNSIDAKYFCSTAVALVNGNSKLLDCTQKSLYLAILQAARLSLNLDGLLGQAYLIPYGPKAQLVIGFKGLRELALRTNKYKDLRARVVYEKDIFEIELGTNEFIKHIPFEGDRGKKRGCYAIAICSDGSAISEFMFTDEINKHRDQYSKGHKKSDSAWITATDRMWEKTLIRRLCGRLQMSVVAQQVMGREDKMDAGLELPAEDDIDVIDLETGEIETPTDPDKKPAGVDGLTATLNKKNGKKKPVDADDSQAVDLRIVIQEKIQEIYPKVPWKNIVDEICTAVLGRSETPYDLESLARVPLGQVYAELQAG